MKYARRENAMVSVDPQMSTTGEWSKPFDRILEHIDVLLLDEVEAKRVSRREHVIDAIEKLASKGRLTVAVKAGRKGCIIGKDGRIHSVKPFGTEPVSTIGAGDAIDAAFIYGSLQGWTIDKIGRFSNVVAALSMTKLGCMTAVPKASVAERIAKSYYS
jgi:sugar/nucleoside kinase (ribokinase family)